MFLDPRPSMKPHSNQVTMHFLPVSIVMRRKVAQEARALSCQWFIAAAGAWNTARAIWDRQNKSFVYMEDRTRSPMLMANIFKSKDSCWDTWSWYLLNLPKRSYRKVRFQLSFLTSKKIWPKDAALLNRKWFEDMRAANTTWFVIDQSNFWNVLSPPSFILQKLGKLSWFWRWLLRAWMDHSRSKWQNEAEDIVERFFSIMLCLLRAWFLHLWSWKQKICRAVWTPFCMAF